MIQLLRFVGVSPEDAAVNAVATATDQVIDFATAGADHSVTFVSAVATGLRHVSSDLEPSVMPDASSVPKLDTSLVGALGGLRPFASAIVPIRRPLQFLWIRRSAVCRRR